jgi:hypothetical protein
MCLLVLLVIDSEYKQSAGAKPTLPPSCINLVSPGELLLLLQLRIFAAAAVHHHPTPLPFLGEGNIKKRKSPVASGWRLDMFVSAWAWWAWARSQRSGGDE